MRVVEETSSREFGKEGYERKGHARRVGSSILERFRKAVGLGTRGWPVGGEGNGRGRGGVDGKEVDVGWFEADGRLVCCVADKI
jgi:hypothetical protein